METAVEATLLHVSSTDDSPKHHLCPDGEHSWCFYKRAISSGETPKHTKETMKTMVNPEVAKALEPEYKRLSAPALMRACVRGQTQNANEGLHSLIWAICPKTKFMSRSRIESGASIAINRFNMGASALGIGLIRMGLKTGKNFEKQSSTIDKTRLRVARTAAKEASKEARLAKKHEELQHDEQIARREGTLYGAGIASLPGDTKKTNTRKKINKATPTQPPKPKKKKTKTK